jgi:hypothetical protein
MHVFVFDLNIDVFIFILADYSFSDYTSVIDKI